MFKFFKFRKNKEDRKKITEKLYEQNLELAVKNKTLALLEKLYHTSTLALGPKEMAEAIANIIQQDLNLECAAILRFEKKHDALKPLALAGSERLLQTLNSLGLMLPNVSINNVSHNPFLSQLVQGKIQKTTHVLDDIWGNVVTKDQLKKIQEGSHLKTSLISSLVIGKEALGIIILGFNREYETLSTSEKESIKSFIDPISLLLYKAYLYQNIQRSYAVEKKAKEELEKLDKFKDQFLMTTQHNLRTPLTSMMGYTDLLLKGFFGKQNKKTTEVIQKFQILTQNMIRMVNNFLDMAQFQLGKSVISLKPGVELKTILDELNSELSFKAENKGVTIAFAKPEGDFKVSADREKLKAALFNIIDNAIKYAPKGKVEVDLKMKDGKTILFECKDNGIGISKEKVGHIFDDMFERTEQAKRISSLGSGVGLYLSGEIIKAHHGKAWAESEGEGKGSTFYVELPIG